LSLISNNRSLNERRGGGVEGDKNNGTCKEGKKVWQVWRGLWSFYQPAGWEIIGTLAYKMGNFDGGRGVCSEWREREVCVCECFQLGLLPLVLPAAVLVVRRTVSFGEWCWVCVVVVRKH